MHPVYPFLESWCRRQSLSHSVDLVTDLSGLSGGEILFLISCSEIIGPEIRALYKVSLVIHASDLPAGRGWSPLVWQILEGKKDVAVSLLEAADPVDSGPIWKKAWLHFTGTELYDELNFSLFSVEIELMDFAVENFEKVEPVPQVLEGASWYPRRRPEDSKLDPDRSFSQQFDLLRVSDPNRYPAYFECRGEVYEVLIRRRKKS